MAYAVQDLQPGDIIAVYARGLIGAAISWVINCPYSHIAMVSQGHLVEALATVTRSPLGKYRKSGDLFKVPLTEEQRRRVIKALESKVGQFYGWQMAAEDLLRDVMHIPVVARLNPRGLDCSGLAVWALQEAGVTLTYEPVPSPASVVNSPIPIGPRPWNVASAAALRHRRRHRPSATTTLAGVPRHTGPRSRSATGLAGRHNMSDPRRPGS
jgi:hypothetical protein